MSKKILFPVLLYCSGLLAQIPRPDHVVVVIFENRSFEYLNGNTVKAPYINSLINDSNVALFTQSYALTNPSQPNYLMLYSGSNQGISNDSVPANLPFTTCNLGAGLLAKGFTIKSYCESMPAAGYLGSHYGPYLKRHNPVAYWQGSGPNNTPPEINRPYADFPSNFSALPDVSFVIPDVNHSMHDGTTEAGDKWLEDELKPYINWTRTHHSLLILTFDEDDENHNKHILTLFYGPMVKGGSYNTKINHYNILSTLENMYGISYCGNSSASSPIDYVWKGVTGLKESLSTEKMRIYPVPASDVLTIKLAGRHEKVNVYVKDLTSRILSVSEMKGTDSLNLPVADLKPGIYTVEVRGEGLNTYGKFIVR